MRLIAEAEVHRLLDGAPLVEALRDMFERGCCSPVRQQFTIDGDPGGTLLLMPAWQVGRHIGIKTVTVFPGNRQIGRPSVMGQYLLLDGTSGEPLALIDGDALTARRTAAASALAAGYLARPEATRLLMVGSGTLAPHLVRAHAAARPIAEVRVWSRTRKNAERLAATLDRDGFKVRATDDLEAAARWADIISCATLSTEPLIRGAWLAPGTHLDLVGAFRPDMRESDDDAVARARLFVDTRAGALKEGGDLVQPIKAGRISEKDIVGDLHDLTRGACAGRGGADEITLFKSVGAALEDLAAAQLVLERLAG